MNCNSNGVSNFGNRFGKQCLEAVIQTLFLQKTGFLLPVADTQDVAKMQQYINEGNLVPLFEVYEPTSETVDAANYETGNFVYETAKAVKKLKAEMYLAICAHRSLKKFENAGYDRVIEITSSSELLLVDVDGTNVYGQKVKDFKVMSRKRATKDKAPYTEILITYEDIDEFEDKGIIVDVPYKPMLDLKAVNELMINFVSIAADTAIIEVKTGCGAKVEGLTSANLLFSGVEAVATVTKGAGFVYTVVFDAPVSATGTLSTTPDVTAPVPVNGTTTIATEFYIGETSIVI